MVCSLGCSIKNMYSMRVCSALGISNQDALSEDLENDPFLNSALQRCTCELYYRFGSFLAPLSIGITTSRHYLWGCAGPAGTPLRGATPDLQGPSEHNGPTGPAPTAHKNGERTSGMGDNKNGEDERTAEGPHSAELLGLF